MPKEGEGQGGEGEREEEGGGGPGAVGVGAGARGDVAAVDDGVGHHVEDEEGADGDEVEEDVEVREQRDRRREQPCSPWIHLKH